MLQCLLPTLPPPHVACCQHDSKHGDPGPQAAESRGCTRSSTARHPSTGTRQPSQPVWLHIQYAVQPLSLKCGATLLTVAEFEALPLSERQGLLGRGEKKLRRHAMPCAMCRSCIKKFVASENQLSLVSGLLLCKQVTLCATPAAALYSAREGLVSLFLCISSNHVI